MIIAYTDGAARGNPGPASCAYVIYDDNGELDSGARHLGIQTNNYAEYQGLLDVLYALIAHNAKRAKIYCDSKLVVMQVTGRWKVKHENIKQAHSLCYALMTKYEHTLEHIDGHSGILGNERADELCNEILDNFK